MKKHLLIGSLLIIPKIFFSQEWTYLGQNYKGDKTYIQNSKINPDTDLYPKVWSKEYVGSQMVQKNGKKFSVKNALVVTLDSYDCNQRRKRLEKILIYDSNQNLITSHSYNEYSNERDWYYVSPETTADATLDFVCSKL